MTVVEIMEQAQALNQQERKELVKLLVDSLDVKDEESTTGKRSLLELRGLGAEIWEGIDAQEYVDQLRDEWD
jgi:DNA-binding PucR family transcriptional regulator